MALKYQGRDFLEVRSELRSEFKRLLGGKWNDADESDPLSIIADSMAYLQDNLHFYIDQQKRESDIVTATRLRNVWMKALRDGYKPHMYKAARGYVTLRYNGTRESLADRYSKIESGFVFLSSTYKDNEGPLNFVVSNGVVLIPREESLGDANDPRFDGYERVYPKNELTDCVEFDIPIIQGYLKTVQKTGADITSNFYIKLNSSYVAEGSVRMFYHGQEWTEVDDVFNEYRVGQIFSVSPLWLSSGLTTVVQFGYDYKQNITDTSKITINYVNTEGSLGNIGASEADNPALEKPLYTGGVDTIGGVVLLDDGTDITKDCVCYNKDTISGGDDLESVQSIKANFKRSIRNLSALITLDDYSEFASQNLSSDVNALDWKSADKFPDFFDKDDPEDARVVYLFASVDPTSEIYAKYKKIVDYFNDPLHPERARNIKSRAKDSSGISGRDYYVSFAGDKEAGVPSYEEVWNSSASNYLLNEISSRQGRGDKVYIYGPEYMSHPISAKILLDSLTENEESPETIMVNIIEALDEKYVNAGKEISEHYRSDIIRTIQNVSPRILSVDLKIPVDDVFVDKSMFLRYYIDKESFDFRGKGKEGEAILLPDEEIHPEFKI